MLSSRIIADALRLVSPNVDKAQKSSEVTPSAEYGHTQLTVAALVLHNMPALLLSMPVITYPETGSLALRFNFGPPVHQSANPGIVQAVDPATVASGKAVVTVTVFTSVPCFML